MRDCRRKRPLSCIGVKHRVCIHEYTHAQAGWTKRSDVDLLGLMPAPLENGECEKL